MAEYGELTHQLLAKHEVEMSLISLVEAVVSFGVSSEVSLVASVCSGVIQNLLRGGSISDGGDDDNGSGGGDGTGGSGGEGDLDLLRDGDGKGDSGGKGDTITSKKSVY
ncbi:hypothetical protein Tco_0794743 [Tanacetum coccineum]